MYKTIWRQLGNSLYKTAAIAEYKVIWPLYIADKILERHPHWAWWQYIWGKILTDYGDPLCFAYCFGWTRIYYKFEKQTQYINIPYESLPEDFRKELEDI